MRQRGFLAALALLAIVFTMASRCQEPLPELSRSTRTAFPEGVWPQWRGPERKGLSVETGLLQEWPAAVVGAWEVGQLSAELAMTAMHAALPGRVPACGKAIICNLGFAGDDPRRGEYYCYMETIGGGNGARPGKDGPDGVQTTIHNTENAPIEEVEVSYPIRFAHYELIQDSGGPGRFRGGLGIRRDFSFPDCDTAFTENQLRDPTSDVRIFGRGLWYFSSATSIAMLKSPLAVADKVLKEL